MTEFVQRMISELRELSNDYSPINDHLFEIAQEIERNGEFTAKAVEEMQNTIADCLDIAERLTILLTRKRLNECLTEKVLSELLKGAGYEA